MRIRLPKNEKGRPIEFPSEEDLTNFRKNEKVLRTIRGNIIVYTIEIEHMIEIIISAILFGRLANEKSEMFEKKILQNEWFTLMNKWRILRDLLKGINRDESFIIKKLHEIINIRDRFSHCRIDHNIKGKPPILIYSENGKIKEQTLNNDYFDSLNKLFLETYKELEELNWDIRRPLEKSKK